MSTRPDDPLEESRVTREELLAESRKIQLRRAGAAALSVAAIVIAVLSLFAWASSEQQVGALALAGEGRASQITALQTALDGQRSQQASCAQLIGKKGVKRVPDSCRTPTAPPATKIVPSPAAVSGTTVAVGPSDVQVERAVAAYCAVHTCWSSPSAGQVAAAVLAFCDSHGQCEGPIGSPGARGSVGPTGSQGPPPSDDQVAAAVAGYCAAHDNCRGPAGNDGQNGSDGKDGTDGKDGKDGRGITDVSCTDDGRLQFTFTDGTTQVVGDTNTCRHGGIVPTP